jgi:hypothetical protein
MGENPAGSGKNTWSALAVINKIQTTLDGGTRLTLDFSENDLQLAQELLKIKFQSGQVIVAFQKLEGT